VTVHGEERASSAQARLRRVALIDEGARFATVVAKTDLTCYRLTAWEFRPLVEATA
jgi:hypothetical protein